MAIGMCSPRLPWLLPSPGAFSDTYVFIDLQVSQYE